MSITFRAVLKQEYNDLQSQENHGASEPTYATCSFIHKAKSCDCNIGVELDGDGAGSASLGYRVQYTLL
jgi:hypothetical protein